MNYPKTVDPCLSLFGLVYPQHLDFPPGAHVLEIGCAEADWIGPMKAVRPDLRITGIDWRRCDRPDADVLITGDVLEQDFPPGSFDAVVLISALEHIGLGHYDHDPVSEFGDVACVRKAMSWLDPKGLLYFDVPWNPDRYDVIGTECRVYDDDAIAHRLGGSVDVVERFCGYAKASDCTRFIARPDTRHGRFYYTARVWQTR